MATEFTEANFEEEVIASAHPVMVDFWSEGCAPCRQIAPVIDELSTEYDGSAKVGKVDVGNNMQLAMKYGVTSVPTILVFKSGEVVEKQVGAVPKSQLQTMITNHI